MGVQIPSNMYAPHYFKGNILLLANDRQPKNGERIIFSAGDNLWIAEYKEENGEKNFYSIRDGRKRGNNKDIQYILGYIATHIEGI